MKFNDTFKITGVDVVNLAAIHAKYGRKVVTVEANAFFDYTVFLLEGSGRDCFTSYRRLHVVDGDIERDEDLGAEDARETFYRGQNANN
jgi:hypothetical protein